MLSYKKPKFWIVFSAAVGVIIAAACLLITPELISVPTAVEVKKIEMEQYNEGASLGAVTITDREDIETVLSNLSGANKTIGASVNDFPVQHNYLILRLTLEEERRTMFLYSDFGRYYVEEPYIGIYKSNRNASVAIYTVYTEKSRGPDNLRGDDPLKSDAENFNKLGITIKLPENKNWIGKPDYSIIDEGIAQVKYYDKIAETDMTLRVGKADIQTLSGIYYSFDDEREEIWSAETLDGKHINIKVQYAISDKELKGILASWSYKDFNFSLWGNISDKRADASPIAKTAIYIAKNF